MALTSQPALAKHARMGFGIQTAEGTEFLTDHNVADLTVVPWNDTLDFGRNPNLEVYRQADYLDCDHLVFSSGEWFEGGVPIVIQPVVASMDVLLSWIQDRDSYNQGLFASVYIIDEWRQRKVMDVKVGEASITVNKGRPVDFALQLIGKSDGTQDASAIANIQVAGPYVWNEGVVSVVADVSLGALAADLEFEALEIRIDNSLEDAGEGLRITSGLNPRRLYNLSGIRCTGTFTRDFISAVYFTAWQAQYNNIFSSVNDGSLRLVLTRAAAALQLDMPRVKWMTVRADLPGDNESRIILNVDWMALGDESRPQAEPITLSTP